NSGSRLWDVSAWIIRRRNRETHITAPARGGEGRGIGSRPVTENERTGIRCIGRACRTTLRCRRDVPPRGTRVLTLILGGARSGKSTRALALAKGRVLFVATAEALDDEMAERIQAHKNERPAEWDTLEEPRDIARALRARGDGYDSVIIDCL